MKDGLIKVFTILFVSLLITGIIVMIILLTEQAFEKPQIIDSLGEEIETNYPLEVEEISSRPLSIIWQNGDDLPFISVFINDKGKLEVEGDMTEGAKMFFEYMIKPIVDDYIKTEIQKEIKNPPVYYGDLLPYIPDPWGATMLTNSIQLPLEISFYDKNGEYLGIVDVDLKWRDEHSDIWQSFQEGYWIEFNWNGKEIMAFKTDKKREE